MKVYWITNYAKNKELINSCGYSRYFYTDMDNKKLYFTELTHKVLSTSYKTASINTLLAQAMTYDIPENEIKYCTQKLHYPVQSYLQDLPSKETHEEMLLVQFLKPNFSFEYLGRALSELYDETVPNELTQNDQMFYLDFASGRRKYYWVSREAEYDTGEENIENYLGALKNWFDDANSKVVLYVEGHDQRAFAIPSALKILDLANVKDSVSEIWGESLAGAMSYLYTLNVSPQIIEEQAHEYIRQSKYEKNIFSYALKKFRHFAVRDTKSKKFFYSRSSAHEHPDVLSTLLKKNNRNLNLQCVVDHWKKENSGKKLRIFYISTDADASEKSALEKIPEIFNIFKKDLRAQTDELNSNSQIEVFGLHLHLGQLANKNPEDIQFIIQESRKSLFEQTDLINTMLMMSKKKPLLKAI